MNVFPIGARTRVRDDLKVKDGKKSWAAGHYGTVVEARPKAGGFGDVRIRFESCDYCTTPQRCQAIHWIAIEDLAIRNPLDVVFEVLDSIHMLNVIE